MAKMTKAQTARYHRLQKALNEAQTIIFLHGPDNRTVFSECFKLAPIDVQQAYTECQKALTDFYWEMVNDGRGYFDTFGGFRSHL